MAEKAAICRRQKGTYVRQVAAKMLCRYGGLTQRQVAEILKLSTGSAVSMQLKKLNQALSGNRKLKKQVARVEHGLTEMGGNACSNIHN